MSKEKDEPKAKQYRVISENGLFKNGRHYPTGETIVVGPKDKDGNLLGLSPTSVDAFLETGDIEEIENA